MNEEEVQAFVNKVRDWELEPPERELLDAILEVATDIREENEPEFASDFATSFTKKQADLLIEYVSEATHHHPATIFRVHEEGPHDIIRNIVKSPYTANIIKKKHDG
jgi:hypothetical protein